MLIFSGLCAENVSGPNRENLHFFRQCTYHADSAERPFCTLYYIKCEGGLPVRLGAGRSSPGAIINLI